MFEIQANRIEIDLTKRKKFKYHPYNCHCMPNELYLRCNKLWFIRRKDVGIKWAQTPMQRQLAPASPGDPSDDDIRISYFDLDKEHPTEMHVGTITVDFRIEMPDPKVVYNLQWVKDSLLIQLTETKFGRFDLGISTPWRIVKVGEKTSIFTNVLVQ
jgi:hypothetical protein